MNDLRRNGRSDRRGAAATTLAAALSLLPNISCPACWPAYAGLLSALGVPIVVHRAFLFPLTLIALALALFLIGFRASRRRGYGPFALALVAACIITVGKFVIEFELVVWAGILMLIAASLWNSWPRRGLKPSPCPACEPQLPMIQIQCAKKAENNP